MKHLTKWIGKLLFVVMAGALIAYAASRTLDFVNSTLGAGDQIVGYLALFATTGGALAWLAVFLWNSEGIAQKGIALVMICIDVLGEITLFTVDTLMTSGANGLTVALAPEEIRLTVLGMSFLIGINIIATFAFHIMDAENLENIEAHFSEWKIKQAIQKAKAAKAESIADEIAEREAELYGAAQKAKDRSDKTTPEKTAREIFGEIGSLFSRAEKSKDLPIAAAETVGLPTVKPQEKRKLLYKTPEAKEKPKGKDEKKYLCKWCGSVRLESELFLSRTGTHKICGKLGCGGRVEEVQPAKAEKPFQDQQKDDQPEEWHGGMQDPTTGEWYGI
jgi:hypothetical protein